MDPVKVTNSAWAQIEALSQDHFGLKIGLKKGGCAGMEYDMQLVDEAGAHDLVITHNDTHLVIDARAQMFLFGMEVDYQTGLLESGFQFNNPNVAEACGCGESVSFTIDHDQKGESDLSDQPPKLS